MGLISVLERLLTISYSVVISGNDASFRGVLTISITIYYRCSEAMVRIRRLDLIMISVTACIQTRARLNSDLNGTTRTRNMDQYRRTLLRWFIRDIMIFTRRNDVERMDYD